MCSNILYLYQNNTCVHNFVHHSMWPSSVNVCVQFWWQPILSYSQIIIFVLGLLKLVTELFLIIKRLLHPHMMWRDPQFMALYMKNKFCISAGKSQFWCASPLDISSALSNILPILLDIPTMLLGLFMTSVGNACDTVIYIYGTIWHASNSTESENEVVFFSCKDIRI